MILAVIGFIMVTGLLIFWAFWWLGMWYFSLAMAGWDCTKDGWPVFLAGTTLLVLGWGIWFKYILPLIDISVSLNT